MLKINLRIQSLRITVTDNSWYFTLAENVKDYIFMEANSIADEKKVAVFLSIIGTNSFKLLKSLLTPVAPEKKTLAELIQVLQTHFSPKPL